MEGPPGPSQAIPVDAAGSSSSPAVAKLRKLLFRRMLIGRYFHGLFHCIDKQGNIILPQRRPPLLASHGAALPGAHPDPAPVFGMNCASVIKLLSIDEPFITFLGLAET
jgi:hypothetical protein